MNDSADSNKSSYRVYDPIYDKVLEISTLIRAKSDFEGAAKLALEHSITLQDIVNKTLKLSIFDIAKLADQMNKLK